MMKLPADVELQFSSEAKQHLYKENVKVGFVINSSNKYEF